MGRKRLQLETLVGTTAEDAGPRRWVENVSDRRHWWALKERMRASGVVVPVAAAPAGQQKTAARPGRAGDNPPGPILGRGGRESPGSLPAAGPGGARAARQEVGGKLLRLADDSAPQQATVKTRAAVAKQDDSAGLLRLRANDGGETGTVYPIPCLPDPRGRSGAGSRGYLLGVCCESWPAPPQSRKAGARR
jgi:hypothetical protein